MRACSREHANPAELKRRASRNSSVRARRTLFIPAQIHPSALQGAWLRPHAVGLIEAIMARLERGYAGACIRTSENTPAC